MEDVEVVDAVTVRALSALPGGFRDSLLWVGNTEVPGILQPARSAGVMRIYCRSASVLFRVSKFCMEVKYTPAPRGQIV